MARRHAALLLALMCFAKWTKKALYSSLFLSLIRPLQRLCNVRQRAFYNVWYNPQDSGACQIMEHPSCPNHDISMVPHVFEPPDVALPEGVKLFRCPNLSCSVF